MDEERVGGEEPQAAPGPDKPAPEAAGEIEVTDEPGGLPPNVASALCYILTFVSGAVFLLLEAKDRLVRFHAFQSILMGAVFLILELGIWILGFIPPLGWLLASVLHWIVGLGWIGLSLLLMVRAHAGEEYQLPYIGPRARRMARPFE